MHGRILGLLLVSAVGTLASVPFVKGQERSSASPGKLPAGKLIVLDGASERKGNDETATDEALHRRLVRFGTPRVAVDPPVRPDSRQKGGERHNPLLTFLRKLIDPDSPEAKTTAKTKSTPKTATAPARSTSASQNAFASKLAPKATTTAFQQTSPQYSAKSSPQIASAPKTDGKSAESPMPVMKRFPFRAFATTDSKTIASAPKAAAPPKTSTTKMPTSEPAKLTPVASYVLMTPAAAPCCNASETVSTPEVAVLGRAKPSNATFAAGVARPATPEVEEDIAIAPLQETPVGPRVIPNAEDRSIAPPIIRVGAQSISASKEEPTQLKTAPVMSEPSSVTPIMGTISLETPKELPKEPPFVELPASAPFQTLPSEPSALEMAVGTPRTLTGNVAWFRKALHLRYVGPEGDDAHGGSVTLSGNELSNLRDGQAVRVRGAVVVPARQGQPAVFQVHSLEVVDSGR